MNPLTTKTPSALGGGKPRSYRYRSKFCRWADEIDDYLNQAASYDYIYWNPQAVGVIITLGTVNAEYLKQLDAKPHIERGYEEMSEADAKTATQNQIADNMVSKATRINIDIVLTRLYENGFRLFKPVDKKVKP